MLKSLALALAVGFFAAGAASAQSSNPDYGGRNVQPGDEQPVDMRRETSASRVRDDRRARQPQAPTAEEVMAAARPLAAAAAPACQVTEAALRGAREDGTKLYEVACASGPGYLLEDMAAGPKANDCVLQWSYGEMARDADPAADVGLQCSLPGNQNPMQVIATYGREAGLDCQVDQARALAVDVYEVGCAGRDGWRLEKVGASWKSSPCWDLQLRSDAVCNFSSEDESRAVWPRLVAGSDAAACVPVDVAWMGDNADRGSFYEIKCQSGEGIIVRFKDDAAQQTYSCLDAPQIFRKECTLTPAAATGGRA
ncbi:MAG TPA: hypothetical protein VGR32_08410 [Brevundimonas sp.]|uniref:hypothetical protein n=1 Tax=Brevundimonas sp. TaxID=1871086 RepID=UPI002DF6008D|nr:hypothetical protein [Brevundimonas sp.]